MKLSKLESISGGLTSELLEQFSSQEKRAWVDAKVAELKKRGELDKPMSEGHIRELLTMALSYGWMRGQST